MDVIEAIRGRHSVRDFSSKSVPGDTLMKIFEAANHSPSGINSQPWEVFAATGETLERIRQAYQERLKGGLPMPGARGGPPALPESIKEKMRTLRNERLKWMGKDPNDPAADKVFSELAARLYGAMVLIVVCMDKTLTNYPEMGIYAQTLCLAAYNYGVDSLIAGALLAQPEVLRKELEIPENFNLAVGIGLGYADTQKAINTYLSSRRPLQEVVRLKN